MNDVSVIGNKAMLKQCIHILVTDLDIVDLINASGFT